MRDNDYLRSAYRPPHKSLRYCFHTAFFQLNNDTINVWSHALGCVVFLFLAFHLLGPATSLHKHMTRLSFDCKTPPPPSIHSALRAAGLPNVCIPSPAVARDALASILRSHRIGLLPLLVAAVLCLAFSTIFHAFWVHSQAAFTVLQKLDFLGISLLCTGHALSGIYYTFYCTPRLAYKYYALVAIAEFTTVPAIISPSFSTPRARPIRAAVFCALGSTSILPVGHAAWLHGFKSYELTIAVGSALGALITYGVGAVVYVARFPECCRLGKHDRFLASHQLMHLAVILGVALHLWGCWTLFEYRLEVGCSASPVVKGTDLLRL